MTAQVSEQPWCPPESKHRGLEFLNVQRYWEHAHPGQFPNALTCDVEDYFQVSAFEQVIDRSSWQDRQCRIPQNMDRVLQICEDAGVKATFFILGWVAERYPAIVRRIAAEGHEVASHGMTHIRVWDQSPRDFRDDVARTKQLLEDVCGQRVSGYRAASWSLDRRTPWAHQIMAEVGYRYSSSVYPIPHDHYGIPDGPRWPFYVEDAGILEIPASTVRRFGRNFPAAGGGYFRLLPLAVSRWLLQEARRPGGVPAMFYFHPWELDSGQPRVSGISVKTRFRHYVNINRFEGRLIRLLHGLPWGRMDDIFLGDGL